MKFGTKLLLVFLVVTIVPLLAISFFIYFNARDSLTRAALNHLDSVADIQEHRAQNVIAQNLAQLSLVSSRTQMRASLESYLSTPNSDDFLKINQSLLDALSSLSTFRKVSLLSRDGNVIASTDAAEIGKSFSQEAFFISGLNNNTANKFFIGENATLCLYLSGPVSREGKLLAVMAIESTADDLLEVVNTYDGLGATGETVLAQRTANGDILYITPTRFPNGGPLNMTQPRANTHLPMSLALLQIEGVFTNSTDYRGKPVLAATRYLTGPDWGLVAKIDKAEAILPVSGLRNSLTAAMFVSLVAVVLAAFFLSQGINRPVAKLVATAVTIRDGNIKARSDIKSNDEFGILSRACNQMADSLVKANSDLEQELTARRQAETRIINLNSILKVLRNINQLIVREKDRQQLIQVSCDMLSEMYGNTLAVIVLVDKTGGFMTAALSSPEKKVAGDMLEKIKNSEYVQRIREILLPGNGDVAVFSDEEKRKQCWPFENYHGHGNCVVALLQYEGRIYGAFSVEKPGNEIVESETLDLFRELAGDIAFALAAIEAQEIRAQTEAELRKSEAMLEEAQRMALIGSWELNLKSNVLTWSDEVYRIFDLEPRSFGATYEAFLGNIHPDDRDMVNRAYSESVKHRTPYNIVHRLLLKDGTLKYVNEKCQTFYNNSGEPVRSMGTVQDITEKHQVEQALSDERQRFYTLLESLPVYVIQLTRDYHVAFANRFFRERFGESHGKRCYEFLFKRIAPCEICETFKVLDTGHPLEWEWTGPDKRNYYILDYPFIDIDGSTLIMEVGIDITERKLAEAKVEKAAKEWRATFDSFPDLVSIHNSDYTIARVNKAFAAKFGKNPNDLIGKYCYNIVHGTNEPPPFCPFLQVITTKKAASVEFLEPKIGHIEVICAPVIGENGDVTGYAHVIRDITEKKRIQEQLMLSDRLASIGQLVSGIAHELNNPLTSIIGFSDMLVEKELPKEAKEDIVIINQEAKRTSEIVKGLLTFARKKGLEKTAEDVNAIVQGVLKLRAYEHKVNNIAVDARYAEGLPRVMANTGQLQQVFINIVVNAEQAMLEAHQRGTLKVTTETTGAVVRVCFRDDGPGIEPKNLAKLFTPFFTTKDVGKGTGLGLSTCHGIITEHGGRIYADSEYGKGAAFIIELPAISETQPGPTD